MENIIIKATKHNWGMIRPGGWTATEWFVYDDLTVDVKERYNDPNEENSVVETSTTISDRKLKTLVKEIEKAKEKDERVVARDGVAWEITYYNNDGTESWKRDCAYIYGIKCLEKFADILENLK